MYLNKVQLIGNISQDLELVNSTTSVLPVSLATNHEYKDKNGEKQKEVEFHNLIAFGRTTEVMVEYLQKGDQIYVEGRLRTQTWENEQGEKRYKTQIVVDQFKFGQKKSEDPQPRREQQKSQEQELEEIPF